MERAWPNQPKDRYAGYRDGDALIIVDRQNPNAWIRSTTYVNHSAGGHKTAPSAEHPNQVGNPES